MRRVLILTLLALFVQTSFAVAGKRYNGATWVDTTRKRYNGSLWIDTVTKRYDGATWVSLASSGDYSDIIYYANADTLSTTPQKGTDPLTFTAGILLNTATPITGAGSWDNNDDGFDKITIPSAVVDWDNTRFGFKWRPKENNSGSVWHGGETTVGLVYNSATQWKFYYKDQTTFQNTGLSATDGSQVYWIEVVCTGTTATLYVDNVQRAQLTGATGTLTDSLKLGAYNGNQWNAEYDQFILSNDTSRNLYLIRNNTSF